MAADAVKRQIDRPNEIPEADDRRQDPTNTGDPSSPQGSFWHPEDRHRREAFLRIPVDDGEQAEDKVS